LPRVKGNRTNIPKTGVLKEVDQGEFASRIKEFADDHGEDTTSIEVLRFSQNARELKIISKSQERGRGPEFTRMRSLERLRNISLSWDHLTTERSLDANELIERKPGDTAKSAVANAAVFTERRSNDAVRIFAMSLNFEMHRAKIRYGY